MTDHEKALATAANAYRRANAQADRARKALTDAIRAADADQMRQVDILRATDHVWTREQVRRICLESQPTN
jgi:hypothetical protein